MRRFLIMIAAAVIPAAMFAQGQINTKKKNLEDFPEKTMKVVLSGNVFLDNEIENAIKNSWRISPYEFCSSEEYERLKDSSDHYFLIAVTGRFRKEAEPGIEMLSLVKGGKGSDKSLDKMLEVATVPLRAAESPSGREMVFLPALIDIIQEHVYASMDKDIYGYSGLENYSMNIGSAKGMNMIFSEDDIAGTVPESVRSSIFTGNISLEDEDDADEAMMQKRENTLVSYTVAPADPQPGSFCYKLLIDAGTHKLYYFKKHKITKNTGIGFLAEDLYRIAGRPRN